MRFRIKQQNNLYIPQYRSWWWPFWTSFTNINEGGGSSLITFLGLEAAWNYIDNKSQIKHKTKYHYKI